MLAKMARSAPSAAVRSVNGDDSRPRRQPGLPKRGENAKIRGGSEFIRRIPVKMLPEFKYAVRKCTYLFGTRTAGEVHQRSGLPSQKGSPRFTAEQYLNKAIEYSKLLETANGPNEAREFQRLETQASWSTEPRPGLRWDGSNALPQAYPLRRCFGG